MTITQTMSPIQRRNPLLTWLVFPLITLGIYFFVWYYKIHREMADLKRDQNAPATGPLLVMIFLGWTGIGALISFWRTGTRISEAQESAGLEGTCKPVFGFLLNLVFGLGILYYQLELNKIADRIDPQQ
ncbi:DUF4234 domain-containing protein [Nocardia sp. XZ_19_385]|uniref:DUF4234 domain-containing protein n=1 Tax=Nocardia sp. XZ_19_385 TaxID=2769488 RepID=UPI00188E3302|nr:DUF4234 domain-containing protein [Nocardia sp. XZ_19_385]